MACVSSQHDAEGRCSNLTGSCEGSHAVAGFARSCRSGTAAIARISGSLLKRCEIAASNHFIST